MRLAAAAAIRHGRTERDIDELRKTLIDACVKAGKRVNSVVNHDGFRMSEHLYDDYAEMIQYLIEHHYATTTRYATSAFLRLKMKEASAREVSRLTSSSGRKRRMRFSRRLTRRLSFKSVTGLAAR